MQQQIAFSIVKVMLIFSTGFNKDEIVEMDYADNYFDLLFSLQELLNRKVDLVAEEKLRNPYFIDSINRSKELVYES